MKTPVNAYETLDCDNCDPGGIHLMALLFDHDAEFITAKCECPKPPRECRRGRLPGLLAEFCVTHGIENRLNQDLLIRSVCAYHCSPK
jgi:hypothetical protein